MLGVQYTSVGQFIFATFPRSLLITLSANITVLIDEG